MSTEQKPGYPPLTDGQKQSIRDGMRKRAERGEITCGAPLGYRNAWLGGKKTVVIDQAAAPLLQEAFRLAAEPGLSLRKVLAEVTRLGLKSKQGKPLGSSSLYKILTNPFYCGRLRYALEEAKGSYPALVKQDMFDAVQVQLASRAKNLRLH